MVVVVVVVAAAAIEYSPCERARRPKKNNDEAILTSKTLSKTSKREENTSENV